MKMLALEDLTSVLRDIEVGHNVLQLDVKPRLFLILHSTTSRTDLYSHSTEILNLIFSLLIREDRDCLVQSVASSFVEGNDFASAHENTQRGRVILNQGYVAVSRSSNLAALLANPSELAQILSLNTWFLSDRLVDTKEHSWHEIPRPPEPAVRSVLVNFYRKYCQKHIPIGLRRRRYYALNPIVHTAIDPHRDELEEIFSRFSIADSIPSQNPFKEKTALYFCLHWLAPGGAEKFAIDLIRMLDRNRFYVILSTDRPSEDPWGVRDLVDEFVPLYDLADPGEPHNYIRYLVKARSVRVLHIHHSLAAYRSVKQVRDASPDVRILDTLHINETKHITNYPDISASTAPPHLDYHHVISHQLKDYLQDRHSIASTMIKVGHLSHPRLEQWKQTDPASKKQLKLKYGIPKDSIVVAFVGRLVKQKRPALFIETAHKILNTMERANDPSFNQLHFVMVGSGPLASDCQRDLKKREIQNRFTCLHHMADADELFSLMDLLLLTSENEGIALVTYEAVSARIPVIMSNVGAQSELLCKESLVTFDKSLTQELSRRAVQCILDRDYRSSIIEYNSVKLDGINKTTNGYNLCLNAYSRSCTADTK